MFTTQIHDLAEQIIDSLMQLTNDEYARPLAIFNGSSIGQHTRHVMEFFMELEQGYAQGFVDYENRKRNKLWEGERNAAIAKLQQVARLLDKPDALLQLAIRQEASNSSKTVITTSYYRELVFVIEHTIHHMALIRIGMEQMKSIALPASFGLAASTQRYQSSCAR